MARVATTHDAFNAIAEPRRRQLLELLAGRSMPVSEIVLHLGWPQPMVSKHLGVLRQVGLVRTERKSRQRIYQTNAAPLKAVHDWTRFFERFWGTQLHNIKARAEARAREANEKTKPKPEHRP
jgi:DNA-binding transcriptional ArsR family regulator